MVNLHDFFDKMVLDFLKLWSLIEKEEANQRLTKQRLFSFSKRHTYILKRSSSQVHSASILMRYKN